ncbi:hypothetical protein SERLA73DRAFT_68744 [Serpula lacrymans var. lacrymans S7.3]|uniref:Uncharacterized protein n=1 Tax=Serpula lacrymans var. lacrymans (strain S7.3) TaxID=936435 RepID=F8PI09_SERL3|nr:hypothetical protein SERLA73DRAFT_68744 [Serpula lacrymans var. lacrymans S7.3]
MVHIKVQLIVIAAVVICKECYMRFKKAYPDTWQEILKAFEEAAACSEIPQTIAQHLQDFNKFKSKLVQLVEALANTHDFEVVMMMAGSVVNQDASLTFVHTTPDAENFFQDQCQANNNQIMGNFKAHQLYFAEHNRRCISRPYKENVAPKHDIMLEGSEEGNKEAITEEKSNLVDAHTFNICRGSWSQIWMFLLGEEQSSTAKPKGISDLALSEHCKLAAILRDQGPQQLLFKPVPKLWPVQPINSSEPVIVGVATPHDFSNARVPPYQDHLVPSRPLQEPHHRDMGSLHKIKCLRPLVLIPPEVYYGGQREGPVYTTNPPEHHFPS